jgi:hypothetical protein
VVNKTLSKTDYNMLPSEKIPLKIINYLKLANRARK